MKDKWKQDKDNQEIFHARVMSPNMVPLPFQTRLIVIIGPNSPILKLHF
jgi:hypothetical protein